MDESDFSSLSRPVHPIPDFVKAALAVMIDKVLAVALEYPLQSASAE